MHGQESGFVSQADVLGADEEIKHAHKDANISMGRIMSFYQPSWLAVLSFAASALTACTYPVFGFIFANIAFLFLAPDAPDFIHQRNIWCGCFVLYVFLIGALTYWQKLIFVQLGENLTFTLRKKLFEGIIYKQISWFDNKERAPGALTNILAEDITEINGLTTETISVYMEALFGLVVGFVISACYSWQLALVCISASPFIIAGSLAMSKAQQRGALGGDGGDDQYKEANALLSDIVLNYRTIISFGEKNIDALLAKFRGLLLSSNRDSIVSAHLSGLFFGYSSLARFCYAAFIFYVAGLFILKYNEDPKNAFICVYILFFTAVGCGS